MCKFSRVVHNVYTNYTHGYTQNVRWVYTLPSHAQHNGYTQHTTMSILIVVCCVHILPMSIHSEYTHCTLYSDRGGGGGVSSVCIMRHVLCRAMAPTFTCLPLHASTVIRIAARHAPLVPPAWPRARVRVSVHAAPQSTHATTSRRRRRS